VGEGLYGFVAGVTGQIKETGVFLGVIMSAALPVFSLEFESTCLDIRSPAVRTSSPLQKQTDRSN
jgi:hypothetical protein